MGEKNQIDKMSKNSYMIRIERKEFPKDVIDLLKKNNVKFRVWENRIFKKEFDDTPEELSVVYIDSEIYKKLKKVSEITGIPMEDIANTEIKGFLRDYVSDEPLIFLDKYLGFKNIKDPISIIEKLNDVVNISEEYIEWLKTIDLNAYVDNWNNPLKNLKK